MVLHDHVGYRIVSKCLPITNNKAIVYYIWLLIHLLNYTEYPLGLCKIPFKMGKENVTVKCRNMF